MITMATISEDYVSFETAKLLKEKGFNGECLSMYLTPKPHCGMGNPNQAKIAPHGRDSHYYEGYLYQCEAPTLQIACKWLREEHKIHIIAEPCLGEGFDTKLYFNRWFWTIFTEEGEYKPIRRIDEFESYELAISDAINYCLEHLI